MARVQDVVNKKEGMFNTLKESVASAGFNSITTERKATLQLLIDYIQEKIDYGKTIRLNFICTHNARRSHLSQIWAQAMAFYHGISNVYCYSGGTEATALYPTIAATLEHQGFQTGYLSEGSNPVYAIKFAKNEPPVIGFSKIFDSDFNPQSEFLAVMTCSQADEGCPFIAGAEKRISVRYNDPKEFDESELQLEKYLATSTLIASEMYYVFSKINSYVSN